LVAEAFKGIPARFRKRMKNVALMVEAEPTPEQLARGRVPRGGTLLGLYEGRPLTLRSVFESFAMPDRIVIFQGLTNGWRARRSSLHKWSPARYGTRLPLLRHERGAGARRGAKAPRAVAPDKRVDPETAIGGFPSAPEDKR